MRKLCLSVLLSPIVLIHEKSPYLLQHAHNPVDWYPWGEEAFKAAREQDKPIFLSVVMPLVTGVMSLEQESFENVDVAQLLNDTLYQHQSRSRRAS